MKKYRNVPHLFYQYFNKPREMTRNHFCGVFLKQILARDIFEDVPETSWNRHHFLKYVRVVLRRHTKDILRLHKKTSFWGYIWDVLTLSARRAAGSGTGVCRGRSPLRCTHVGRAYKKQPCFEGNWMNFLKMLVLTLNSH